MCPEYVIEINMYSAYILGRNEIYYVQQILYNSQRFLNNWSTVGEFVKTAAKTYNFMRTRIRTEELDAPLFTSVMAHYFVSRLRFLER